MLSTRNLECIELNCSISYLNEEKNYSKKIALVLKDYKQKNKIMKQIVNGMKKPDENVIVRDYYPESKIAIYDKNEGLADFSLAIACADLFIAGSTGPLHIAGALNVPTIGFYPSRLSAQPQRWRPINAEDRHLAFMPPLAKTKAEQMNLSLISISDALTTILPFITKHWQM